MGKPENNVQSAILEWLGYKPNCMFFRVNTMGVFDPVKKIYRPLRGVGYVKGAPDIMVCYKGKGIAIECKSEKGRQTPDQEAFQASWEAAGGMYILTKDVDTVISRMARL